MNRNLLRELIEPILNTPTGPFYEDHVASFVAETVRGTRLTMSTDTFGNILVRRPSVGRNNLRIGFMAHMDHPAFEVIEQLEGAVRVAWHGGVDAEYFPQARVRFHSPGNPCTGEIREVELEEARNRVKTAVVACDSPPSVGTLATWELPPVEVTNGVLRAPAVDDVAGCGLLLALLLELGDRPLETEVWTLFTRAEEVGFVGAIGLARSGRLPVSTPVVSVEMSKATAGVTQGMGPVIRLGDRSSIFDAMFVLFMKDVASDLKGRIEGFKYQQAMMEGGSCEATALNLFGYRTAGLAVPLTNYHNQRPSGPSGPFVIDSEEIAINDFANAVDLCVGMCERFRGLDAIRSGHRSKAVERAAEGLQRLERMERARTRR